MSWIKSFFGTQQTTPAESSSPIEVIVYVASLASSPKAIDPILDGLREVTARVKDISTLNDQDQTTLANVYKHLEEYLTNQDPLRVLSKEALHQKIHEKFQVQGSTHAAFWHKTGLN